ncbi:MAG: hypothetical protein DRO12_06415 [Thermoprotei archaeon]|nr:MAG: hypothetical protein DRO12_06415 [Thermoprotei archaeon]
MPTNIYVQAFKELIDEVIRENKSNPQKAKELIINEVLREAKKAFSPEDYQEIKMYAVRKLMELNVPIGELERLLE